jgi:hypothetical protein
MVRYVPLLMYYFSRICLLPPNLLSNIQKFEVENASQKDFDL